MDEDCISGLQCGVDNCDTALGFPTTYDCCYDPDPCADGSGGVSCCTSSNPCEVGYGDCDNDDECIGTLQCGQGNDLDNNCDVSLGFGATYDCCYDPERKTNQSIYISKILDTFYSEFILDK